MKRIVRLLLVLIAVQMTGCGAQEGPFDRVERALAEGREQDAWVGAVSAVAADSGSSEAWLALARASLRTWRTVDGVPAAARAVELGPEDWRAYLVKAELDQARFRNVAALAAAEIAAEKAPGEPRVWRALGELRLGGGMVGTADPEGAESAFREALTLRADDQRARFGLVQAMMLAGRHEEAWPELTQVLAAGDAPIEARYERGLALMRRREHEAAADDFRWVVRAEPTHHPAWFNLGRLLPRLGHPDEGKMALSSGSAARQLSERTHAVEVAWHERGETGAALQLTALLRHADRLGESHLLGTTLVSEHPSLPVAQLELAETALEMGRVEEALTLASRSLELNASNPRTRLVLARARLAAGDPDGALRALGDAARGGRDPRAAVVVGRAMTAAGRPGIGQRTISAALETSPRNVEWLIARAEARFALGSSGRAEDDLRVAIAEDPHEAGAWELLARVLSEAGRPEADEARETAAQIREERAAIARAREIWWRTDFLVP